MTVESKGYLLAKRGIDLSGAILGLIIFSWAFLLVPLLIKWENPKGPVFFRQLRVGKNGRIFYIYKFRSMVVDAVDQLPNLLPHNEISGAMFKIKKDPRITRVGRWIRKTSIDELPQIFNVLKGDMSLVGPRPALPREVQEYSFYEKQRLLVTPGCTGLWQISARNHVDFSTMVEMDLAYIKHRSVLYDIKIIVKTFLLLFGSSGAY